MPATMLVDAPPRRYGFGRHRDCRVGRTSGRFDALMELYESNYILLRLLAPHLKSMKSGTTYVSRVNGCMDLELSNIEHSRYTTTFNLTYRFTEPGRKPREPDLLVRLYHDARACEVVTGILSRRRPGNEADVPRVVRTLDGSARMNRFLHKWVRYCLRQGHGFGNEQVNDPSATVEISEADTPNR